MYKKIIILILTIGVSFMLGMLLTSCMGNVDQYKNETPKLDIKTYLNGKIKGYGIIENWKGVVTSRFDFYGDASWQGDVGTFKEKMVYYNGKEDNRIWTIKKISNTQYVGHTDDLIGEAKIDVSGNAMNWQYQMNVDVDGTTYKLSFNDWMFLMNDGILVNINYFKKFGLTVGKLSLFMQRQDKQ